MNSGDPFVRTISMLDVRVLCMSLYKFGCGCLEIVVVESAKWSLRGQYERARQRTYKALDLIIMIVDALIS